MGTGTSHGIPVIACDCPVCRSKDKHDRRLRCSAYIAKREEDGSITRIVIDTGPEFRLQALKYAVIALNAVLLTHSHADHLHGLDDVRVFSHTTTCHDFANIKDRDQGLALYANANTIEDIKYRFAYIFKQTQNGGGKPKLQMIDCAAFTPSSPLVIGSISILPVPLLHGGLPDSGWILSGMGKDGKKHSIVYLTDCNYISQQSMQLVAKESGSIEHLIIDALRKNGHSTHCSFDEALGYADQIRSRHTWFTHICHDTKHEDIKHYIEERLHLYPHLQEIKRNGGTIEPAYDGLVLQA